MNKLYKRIEDMCKERGVSITKMCKEAGVSRAPLTELKMNRTQKLSLENLEKIAVYFGVSVSEIYGDAKPLPPPAHPEYDNRIVELYWSLTPEGRDLLLDYAEMLQDRYGQKNNPVLVKEITA